MPQMAENPFANAADELCGIALRRPGGTIRMTKKKEEIVWTGEKR